MINWLKKHHILHDWEEWEEEWVWTEDKEEKNVWWRCCKKDSCTAYQIKPYLKREND